MECWLCGREVIHPLYHVEDEWMRYPLCGECDKTVDLRLVLMEREVQGMIDQIAESEI